MSTPNTFTGVQSGVGTVFYNPSSDPAAEGITTKYINVYAQTANYTMKPEWGGHFQVVTAASAVTATLPNTIMPGFKIQVMQGGAGQVIFATATGATLVNNGGFTKTKAQNAVVTLVCVSNVDGASAKYVLYDDAGA